MKIKFKRTAYISMLLVLTIIMGSINIIFGGFGINAQNAEKLIFADDFEREDTAVSSNTQNGNGYGVGNNWNEATYGYTKLQDGKLVLTNGGNMASSKFMANRLFRPDWENSLNQTVTITIDTSEIASTRAPMLWTRLQPVIWKRNYATGYYMYLDGKKVYFGKAIGSTDANFNNGYSCPFIADGAVGELTVSFTVTQKDTSTTTLSAKVSGYTSDGTELLYDGISIDDTTAELQTAGNAGVSFIDVNGGDMRINSFSYSTTDAEAPVRIKTDNFEGAALDSAWQETVDNTLSLENGYMKLAYGGSTLNLDNRVQYNSSIYAPTVSQFVSVEVPVADVDNRLVNTEGSSYPILFLRDQTVNGTQKGYYMIYNGYQLKIMRIGSTESLGTANIQLNGENYAQDDNMIFQFSAIGTNPTVLQARIYGSFDTQQEQQSLMASVYATDSDESLQITTAGVPSIGMYRTMSVDFPLHIDKFVYYTTGAVDYSALNDTIDEAQALLEKADEYREDSISGLESAIANAQSILTSGGATQDDVDAAVAELKEILENSVRFPTITSLKVNGIPAESVGDMAYNVLLSKTAETAKFDIATNFTDGVTATVSDGTEENTSLPFTGEQEAYTLKLSYNGETEIYTVNASRGTKHTIVVESGENGSISGEGVTYVDNGSSASFTLNADYSYNVKSLIVDDNAISVPANNTVSFTNVTGDHTVYADFEKTLLMLDSATVSFDGKVGLRFSADVSASGVEHLDARVKAGVIKSYTIGTIMLPFDLLGNNNLTLESDKVLNIKRTVWKKGDTEGYKRMTAIITDVHSKNYNRGIAARVYLTVTDANGNVSTLYSDFDEAKNVARVRNLAQELLNDSSAYSNSELAILKNYAELPVSVTTEQQALLNENLAARHITVEADIDVPFSIALFNDAHLISTDGEYDSEAQKTSAKARKIYFQKAEEKLMRGLSYADKLSDLKKIIFIGDTVDASTKDTWLSFQSIVGDRINKTIVIPGNHEFTDYTDGFPADVTARDAYYSKFSSYFNNNPNFYAEIVNGVNLVAMDNALEYFTAEQVTKLKAEIAKGYPIILFYHVPLNMDGLAAEDTIAMNEDTRAMYDLINENSNIIKAAFCGHAHKEYNGFLNGGNVPQYILNSTYGGEGGRTTILTIGKNNIPVVPDEPADEELDIFSKFRTENMAKTNNSVYSEVYTNQADNTVVRYLSLKAEQMGNDVAYITMMADSHISDTYAPQNAEYVSKGLKYADSADMVVMLGDNVNSSTNDGSVDTLKKVVWDKFPNNICVFGNHELEYAKDENKPAQREKLEEIWPHNTLYCKKILKNNLYLIGMDNASETFSFTEEQCELLKTDISLARKNGAAIILLQHIAPTMLDNALGANAQMAELLANNGDVIKAVFSGHNHLDALDYIDSSYKTADGMVKETVIPCYRLMSSKYDEAKSNYGAHVLVLAVHS